MNHTYILAAARCNDGCCIMVTAETDEGRWINYTVDSDRASEEELFMAEEDEKSRAAAYATRWSN